VRPSLLVLLAFAPAAVLSDCSSDHATGDAGVDTGLVASDAKPTPAPRHDGPTTLFSELPGTLCFAAGGKRSLVSGGRQAPSLTWLTLPEGFCVHYFAHVPTTRQMRVAPGGEIFVASPSTPNASQSGAPLFGVGGVVVLHDDDGDGYADGDALPHPDGSAQKLTLFTHVASVQGLLFAPGSFYFQNGTRIMKVAYKTGQRAIAGTRESVIDVSAANGRYVSQLHWPKTLDRADDGTIYVGNGGDQSQVCDPSVFPRPFTGGILKIDGTPGGTPVAQGFRNPIAIRCHAGHNLCFSTELALDESNTTGGREKIVPIRQGDDWGYPCCATTNLPYADLTGSPNCSQVASETVALDIGNTPFNFDFEPGSWPAPYTRNVVVTLHGHGGTFVGERVIAIPTDSDGAPVPSSDLDGSTVPELATGWDGTLGAHGRPSSVTFATDGRAYIGNDATGDIFWIAPAGLRIP
jgi:glucose/arabinose dehydrogenase